MLIALRGRRHIAPFTSHRPESLSETLALRSAPGTSAFMAGGTDLIDWLKHGNAVDRIIRLDGLPELAKISGGPESLRIGAMARHADIAGNELIRTVLPDLTALWNGVANPRVRFGGTIGGNVMAAHPDYDALPALMALGAEAEIASEMDVERVPLERLSGLPRPLLTGFTIAAPATLRLFADRTLRPALSVWLGLTVESGRVRALRLAVGMAHRAPVHATLTLDVEPSSLPVQAGDIAAEVSALLPDPISDGRASAGYRRRMIGVLTRRILARYGDVA